MRKLLRRWIKGIRYGCGRCHHPYFYHIKGEEYGNQSGKMKDCDLCNCKKYSIERVVWWKVLFNIYS